LYSPDTGAAPSASPALHGCGLRTAAAPLPSRSAGTTRPEEYDGCSRQSNNSLLPSSSAPAASMGPVSGRSRACVLRPGTVSTAPAALIRPVPASPLRAKATQPAPAPPALARPSFPTETQCAVPHNVGLFVPMRGERQTHPTGTRCGNSVRQSTSRYQSREENEITSPAASVREDRYLRHWSISLLTKLEQHLHWPHSLLVSEVSCSAYYWILSCGASGALKILWP